MKSHNIIEWLYDPKQCCEKALISSLTLNLDLG